MYLDGRTGIILSLSRCAFQIEYVRNLSIEFSTKSEGTHSEIFVRGLDFKFMSLSNKVINCTNTHL